MSNQQLSNPLILGQKFYRGVKEGRKTVFYKGCLRRRNYLILLKISLFYYKTFTFYQNVKKLAKYLILLGFFVFWCFIK